MSADLTHTPVQSVGIDWKDSLRFWESGRLLYNGAQLLLTMVMLLFSGSRSQFFLPHLGDYWAFAVVANILYCAAYVPEVLLHLFRFGPCLQPARWVILLGGIAFACFLAFIAMDAMILQDPNLPD